jgi:hypothetical protein
MLGMAIPQITDQPTATPTAAKATDDSKLDAGTPQLVRSVFLVIPAKRRFKGMFFCFHQGSNECRHCSVAQYYRNHDIRSRILAGREEPKASFYN